MKKSKVTKKKSKSASSRKAASSARTVSKTPLKMPTNTFDAWIAKQVKAENKRESIDPVSKPAETALPKDTFEIWIEKQKPKEVVAQRSMSSVPDTFELWMTKQVAQKSSDEEKQAELTTEVSGASS